MDILLEEMKVSSRDLRRQESLREPKAWVTELLAPTKPTLHKFQSHPHICVPLLRHWHLYQPPRKPDLLIFTHKKYFVASLIRWWGVTTEFYRLGPGFQILNSFFGRLDSVSVNNEICVVCSQMKPLLLLLYVESNYFWLTRWSYLLANYFWGQIPN